jgi:sRNA-binding protein
MKKSLLIVLVGLGVGYVLGARAGRERYDLIVDKVTGVWEDPRVARARHEAARYAREQAPVIREKAQAVAKAAPGVVADRAKDVAAAARATTATAKDLADRTVATTRRVASRSTTAATSAAATAAQRVGEVRDNILEDDDE